ncbi:hypothetical protein BYT27DRAFT_7208251 [Phlegmacium glaucopus]|nr:hypothetical protein BYT27DRAFT_7208251 [Phlegmacium glaucopus]
MAADRENWRKERADHHNREHQEEEEKRAMIVWQDLKPSYRCLRYGTREYSATLAQVPIGLDHLKECWNKSIDIHGRQVFPSRCDTQGMCGTVVGHWVVNFNEAVMRYMRYESILMNLQNSDDWHEMCATTPGHVQGRDFDGPTSWRSGINAIWLVEDENCL